MDPWEESNSDEVPDVWFAEPEAQPEPEPARNAAVKPDAAPSKRDLARAAREERLSALESRADGGGGDGASASVDSAEAVQRELDRRTAAEESDTRVVFDILDATLPSASQTSVPDAQGADTAPNAVPDEHPAVTINGQDTRVADVVPKRSPEQRPVPDPAPAPAPAPAPGLGQRLVPDAVSSPKTAPEPVACPKTHPMPVPVAPYIAEDHAGEEGWCVVDAAARAKIAAELAELDWGFDTPTTDQLDGQAELPNGTAADGPTAHSGAAGTDVGRRVHHAESTRGRAEESDFDALVAGTAMTESNDGSDDDDGSGDGGDDDKDSASSAFM